MEGISREEFKKKFDIRPPLDRKRFEEFPIFKAAKEQLNYPSCIEDICSKSPVEQSIEELIEHMEKCSSALSEKLKLHILLYGRAYKLKKDSNND